MPPERLLAALAVAALAAGPPAASAAVPAVTDHVVLNELLVTPGEEREHEALELYNPTPREVPLEGWRLRSHTPESDDCGPAPSVPGRLSGTMGPGELRVIRLPNFWGEDDTCLALLADGDWVRLEDPAGDLVDAVCWGWGCEAGDGPQAPAWVEPGDTIYRCHGVSGATDGPADGEAGTVDWSFGEPSLGDPNHPCAL